MAKNLNTISLASSMRRSAMINIAATLVGYGIGLRVAEEMHYDFLKKATQGYITFQTGLGVFVNAKFYQSAKLMEGEFFSDSAPIPLGIMTLSGLSRMTHSPRFAGLVLGAETLFRFATGKNEVATIEEETYEIEEI